MELTINYILSQVFTIINYGFLVLTYQLKNRTKILIANIMSLIAMAISFVLLKGYSGAGIAIISIIRNILFMLNDNSNSNKVTKKDIYCLLFIYILIIFCILLTYNGFWSLMTVFASMTYTYSVWQKNTKTYKILGILVGIFSIIYNVYLKSILGTLLEVVLTISAIIGYLRESQINNKSLK